MTQKTATVFVSYVRFCKIESYLVRFGKIERYLVRFCKIESYLVRFCKNERYSVRFCKIEWYLVSFCKIESYLKLKLDGQVFISSELYITPFRFTYQHVVRLLFSLLLHALSHRAGDSCISYEY